jgi:hypothetical protein
LKPPNFYQKNKNHRQISASILISNTGQIASILINQKPDLDAHQKTLNNKLSRVFENQSLAISLETFDVKQLNALAFEGICLLTAKKDYFFPVTGNSMSGESQMYKLINMRLSSIRKEVDEESAFRSKRIGDNHKCEK